MVPLFGILFWWNGFIDPPIIAVKNAMPLFELLSFLAGFSLVSKSIVAFILLVISSFYFNYLVDRFGLLKRKSFIPALIFIVLMSSSKSLICLQPVIPATLCLLIALHKLMLTYRQDIDLSDFFDASFFISLASLFYFPSIMFFPLVWVGLIVIRPFIWREWIVSFVGILLPYLFAGVWYFYFDNINVFINQKIFFPEEFELIKPYLWNIEFKIYTGLLLLFFLFSVFYFFLKIPVNTIFTRNLSVIFVWLLILSLLVYFMAPSSNINYLSFIGIPFSFYLSNVFLELKKNWLNELLFVALTACICINALEIHIPF